MIKTHKRLVRLLCLLLVVALMPLQVTASDWPGMEAFQLPEELPAPPFYRCIASRLVLSLCAGAICSGAHGGTGNDGFSPNGTVPLTQGLTVAVRIYEKYWGIPDASAKYGSPWYAYYVSRARGYGLFAGVSGTCLPSSGPATRAELSEILSRSLPEIELEPIHQVDSLPDYSPEDLYWNGVITLYRAGVLMGNDDSGTFRPDSNIRRSAGTPSSTRWSGLSIGFSPAPSNPLLPDTGMDAFKLPSRFRNCHSWMSPPQRLVLLLCAGGLCHGDDERHGDERFAPNGTVRLCQAVAVAVRIYEILGHPRHLRRIWPPVVHLLHRPGTGIRDPSPGQQR